MEVDSWEACGCRAVSCFGGSSPPPDCSWVTVIRWLSACGCSVPRCPRDVTVHHTSRTCCWVRQGMGLTGFHFFSGRATAKGSELSSTAPCIPCLPLTPRPFDTYHTECETQGPGWKGVTWPRWPSLWDRSQRAYGIQASQLKGTSSLKRYPVGRKLGRDSSARFWVPSSQRSISGSELKSPVPIPQVLAPAGCRCMLPAPWMSF